MVKVDIKILDSTTANDVTATKTINDNFEALQNAVEDSLSRSGKVPNYMQTDLDLNHNKLINLAEPKEDRDAVTLKYVKDTIGNAKEYADKAEAEAIKANKTVEAARIYLQNSVDESRVWAKKAEEFANDAESSYNMASASATQAQESALSALASKEYAEQAATNENLVLVATDLNSETSNIKAVVENMQSIKDAIISAEQAAQSATEAHESSEQASNKLTEITNVVSTGKSEINTAVDEAIMDISDAKAQVVSDIQPYVLDAKQSAETAQYWAEQAQSSSDIESAVLDNVGRLNQLGYYGTLSGGILTFEQSSEEETYELKKGFTYLVDLLFEAVGELSDDIQVVIKNGTDTINIVNVLHDDTVNPITVGELKQIMKYSTDIGWRWLFNAWYTETQAGSKVLVMPSTVVAGGSGGGSSVIIRDWSVS